MFKGFWRKAMAMNCAFLFFFFFFFFFFINVALLSAGVGPTAGEEIHKVGDASGWTILGNVNYTDWAAKRTFSVGDTIVFVYNKQFHNVMQVSKDDYHTCTASSSIATYTTGNDTIQLKRKGHYFFICGIPGHCAAGQRVDVRIPKVSLLSPSPSTSTAASSPASTSPSPPSSPSPSPSSSHAHARMALGSLVLPLFILGFYVPIGY